MKPSKNQITLIIGLVLVWSNTLHGQRYTDTKVTKIPKRNCSTVKITSTYTNIELEEIDSNEIILESIMEIEGITHEEATSYFHQWKISTAIDDNTLSISTESNEKTQHQWQRQGYYDGYFISKEELATLTTDYGTLENVEAKNTTGNKQPSSHDRENKFFDKDAYIEKGDAYLLEWQRKHQEKIGKRWFHKTREQRKAMLNATKASRVEKPLKDVQTPKHNKPTIPEKMRIDAAITKEQRPKANVRSLNKRTIIKKTLKIGIPYGMGISLDVRHGRINFPNGANLLDANLKYVLFQAGQMGGQRTEIKSSYSNFEIEHWKSGNLDVDFSDFVLIDRADELEVQSNASVVSIDTVTERISAKGNFRMLSIQLSPTLISARMDLVDSKRVWLKLPDTAYNLLYSGKSSTLIHPDKFTIKAGKTPKEQLLESKPLPLNQCTITISALQCTMQIYDTPWGELKIKSLEGF